MNQLANLWDKAIAQSRVYSPPPVTPATIEGLADLVGKVVCFIKVIREADSQYGHSVLVGIIVQGEQHTDTVWLSEKTVLYRQVMHELKNGKFVAMVAEFESRANQGQTYYSLVDPNNPRAVEARVASADDLPF